MNTKQEPAPKMTTPHTWTMDNMMDLATGYWRSAVLSAAVELNIFDLLSDGPRTLENLAQQSQTAPRHLAELLDTLTALQLLTKENNHYAIEASADHLLNKNSPQAMVSALRYNMDLYPIWGQLAQSIRNGAPVQPPTTHLGDNPERTQRFVMGMHGRALALAPALLPALNPQNATTLLDIGAGPGTFSRLLAEQHPHLNVTQFELPEVQKTAKTLTQSSPAADRIHFHPGNYHTDPLPTGFDIALLSGAIHQEEDKTAAHLIQKIVNALNPNGRFIIVDMMLDANRVGPLFSNLFSLNMMMTSAQGRVFAAQHLEILLKNAGFHNITTNKPPHLPYWIIDATRS